MPKRLNKVNVNKKRHRVNKGVIHVKASLHNTMVTITDFRGEVLCWSSAGSSGFKSKKKK
jgi:small subunit ribosomal protein S11